VNKTSCSNVQDRDGARFLLSQLGGACKKLRLIWVNGGYRGRLLDCVAQHSRFQLQVVPRSDNQKGFVVLPRRRIVKQ